MKHTWTYDLLRISEAFFNPYNIHGRKCCITISVDSKLPRGWESKLPGKKPLNAIYWSLNEGLFAGSSDSKLTVAYCFLFTWNRFSSLALNGVLSILFSSWTTPNISPVLLWIGIHSTVFVLNPDVSSTCSIKGKYSLLSWIVHYRSLTDSQGQ